MTEKWGRSGLLVFGHEANWTALVKRHYAGMEPSDQGLEAVAKLMQAAPEMREALEAHRAWSYAEKHGLGDFYQRTALCAHAESLTLRALAPIWVCRKHRGQTDAPRDPELDELVAVLEGKQEPDNG